MPLCFVALTQPGCLGVVFSSPKVTIESVPLERLAATVSPSMPTEDAFASHVLAVNGAVASSMPTDVATASGAADVRFGRLRFVGLSSSGQTGTAVAAVMTALARKNAHIPYRDSKLTRLLAPSFGTGCPEKCFVTGVVPLALTPCCCLCLCAFWFLSCSWRSPAGRVRMAAVVVVPSDERNQADIKAALEVCVCACVCV